MAAEIVTAAIAAIPPTLAAAAAWANARKAKAQTNGALHGPLNEIKETVADLAADMRDVKAEVRELKREVAAGRGPIA